MFEFESRVRYSEVDSQRNLTWLGLMDYFQDCSVFHSEKLDLGVDYLTENHIAWVLASWRICVDKMPKLTDLIKVQTWPYEMKGFYGYRNFAILDETGTRCAYADSTWVLMNMDTGRPARIPEHICNTYDMNPPIEMGEKIRKLTLPEEYEEKEPISVPSFFIDTNEHMNNSKYFAVASEFLPEDFEVKELRVEYKKSAVLGDVIIPRVTVEDDMVTVGLMTEDGKPYAIVQLEKG